MLLCLLLWLLTPQILVLEAPPFASCCQLTGRVSLADPLPRLLLSAVSSVTRVLVLLTAGTSADVLLSSAVTLSLFRVFLMLV